MKARTKKREEIEIRLDQAENGSMRRTVPVLFRRGSYATIAATVDDVDGFSVTHVASGMRIAFARTEAVAKWATRRAADYMPASLDDLLHGQDPRTQLPRAELRRCAEINRDIKAEIAKRES